MFGSAQYNGRAIVKQQEKMSVRYLWLFPAISMLCPPLFGCGLDWSLPHGHFASVEDGDGYVSYWETIGQVDLGDGLVIPVHINFNSHREASSPTLGKGWLVALLESHIEPVNENCMDVIMPDGWTFTFLRNGNTETWRGNSGWVGESNNTAFTITASCGWKVKFDQGKIVQIDGNNHSLCYKYNGNVAVEIDEGIRSIVKVESNTTTGAFSDIIIGDQKVNIILGQRPRISTFSNQLLLSGFDSSLKQLDWGNGLQDVFSFGVDKSFVPNLKIEHANKSEQFFTWDPTTHQIKNDGRWAYTFDETQVARSDAHHTTETYAEINGGETTIEGLADGSQKIINHIPYGPAWGKIRNIKTKTKGVETTIYFADYDEKGKLIRVSNSGAVTKYIYDDQDRLSQLVANNKIVLEMHYDSNGRIIEKNIVGDHRELFDYGHDARGVETIQYPDGEAYIISKQAGGYSIADNTTSTTNIIPILSKLIPNDPK